MGWWEDALAVGKEYVVDPAVKAATPLIWVPLGVVSAVQNRDEVGFGEAITKTGDSFVSLVTTGKTKPFAGAKEVRSATEFPEFYGDALGAVGGAVWDNTGGAAVDAAKEAAERAGAWAADAAKEAWDWAEDEVFEPLSGVAIAAGAIAILVMANRGQ